MNKFFNILSAITLILVIFLFLRPAPEPSENGLDVALDELKAQVESLQPTASQLRDEIARYEAGSADEIKKVSALVTSIQDEISELGTRIVTTSKGEVSAVSAAKTPPPEIEATGAALSVEAAARLNKIEGDLAGVLDTISELKRLETRLTRLDDASDRLRDLERQVKEMRRFFADHSNF